MDIFISWSGERSKKFAGAFKQFLRRIIQASRPWVSEQDISAGEQWLSEIRKKLDSSSFGIICITNENINSPWVNFEAGALSKQLEKSRVVPYLLDFDPARLAYPLGMFQAKTISKDDTRSLIKSINLGMNENEHLPISELDEAFEMWWDSYDKSIKSIEKSDSSPPQEQSLEELVRSLSLKMDYYAARNSSHRELEAEIVSNDSRKELDKPNKVQVDIKILGTILTASRRAELKTRLTREFIENDVVIGKLTHRSIDVTMYTNNVFAIRDKIWSLLAEYKIQCKIEIRYV